MVVLERKNGQWSQENPAPSILRKNLCYLFLFKVIASTYLLPTAETLRCVLVLALLIKIIIIRLHELVWFSSEMARPTGSMLLAFSDHQAAGFSSSDEEVGELAWNVEDELTEDSGNEAESEEETTDDENEVAVERKSKYTKREALEVLKEENGDFSNATHRILHYIT